MIRCQALTFSAVTHRPGVSGKKSGKGRKLFDFHKRLWTVSKKFIVIFSLFAVARSAGVLLPRWRCDTESVSLPFSKGLALFGLPGQRNDLTTVGILCCISKALDQNCGQQGQDWVDFLLFDFYTRF